MQFLDGTAERAKVLSIYDRGGQDCFNDLHDVLSAPGGTCYVAVFSMVELAEEATREKALDQLRRALTSVAVHAADAPVMLVGTRRAEVEGRALATAIELSDMLRSRLKDCPSFANAIYDDGHAAGAAAGLCCFFAVENKLGHADGAVLRLAAAIDKATDGLPTMQKKVPAAWLRVFDRLRALARPADAPVTAAATSTTSTIASPSQAAPPQQTIRLTIS